MKKKVLILTYYWPPAGGPGVQRWLKFVKYLPEFNVEPVVYIPENPVYPLLDESLLEEVPKGITILSQPIKEPYKWARLLSDRSAKTISKGVIPKQKKQSFSEKLMLFIRGNFFIPDARKSWIKPSVEFLSKYLKEHSIDTIITTGPPHSLHLIGQQLNQLHDVRWIADFRDPWTTIGYHKKLKLTAASAKKHKQLEASVLQSAEQIIVTSAVTKNEFAQITTKPIAVITNGYDFPVREAPQLDEKFTISHIGSLLSERNPHLLWNVLRELITENEAFTKSFHLNLIGTISEEVLDSIKENDLEIYTSIVGYVPHHEAIKYQQKSQVLLLIEINREEAKCIIPGKLFEYMAAKRPILAFGPDGSDVQRILKETQSGTYFNYKAHDQLKSVILDYFTLYSQSVLKSDPVGLKAFNRRELTKSLSELI